MEKINCDIIGDLLPSYLDEICSEQTKQYVEQHMQSCQSCREKAALLKKTDFSVKKLEQKEIDAVKKVKGYIKNIGVTIYVLVWAVVLLGLMAVAHRHSNGFSINLYDFILPLSMIGTYLLTLLQTEKRKLEKSDIALGIFSILIDIYARLLIYYSLAGFRNGTFPFGIKEESALGPFISIQLRIAVLIQIVIFAWILFKTMNKGYISSILPNICLFGAAYIMSIHTWLSMLDSSYYFPSMFRTTKYIFVIGIIGTIVIYFIDRLRWNGKLKRYYTDAQKKNNH